MAKALAKVTGPPRTSSKIHRHLKKLGHSHVILNLQDMQRSLSGIGVSLSTRVIEERATR